MNIAGSTFIVTGGASGLGGATARMIVDAGGRVVIADLKDAEGQAHAAALGGAARFVRTDVTDEASAKAAVAAAVEGLGNLRGLVNCAVDDARMDAISGGAIPSDSRFYAPTLTSVCGKSPHPRGQ